MTVVDLGEMAMLRYGADGDVPVCPRCSALVAPLDHYCAECHAPQGLTPSILFVDMWTHADFLARFADSVTRSWVSLVLFVVVLALFVLTWGVLLAFGPPVTLHDGPPLVVSLAFFEPWGLTPVFLLVRACRRCRR